MQDEATRVKRDDAMTGPENRRARERFPINCKIHVTPTTDHGTLLGDEVFIAFARDISRSGISFTHDLPLVRRRFILTFNALEFGEFIVEAEVVRSQLTAIGLYESGFRIVRKIVTPLLFST